MEQFVYFGGIKVLITTASDKHECQAWDWWDEADVVVSLDGRGACVLKGQKQ